MNFKPTEHPHRRYNILTGDWILVSPHRNQRPWQGNRETPSEQFSPEYDPECYLCPENKRANGATNPKYTQTYVFPNDFPALFEDIPKPSNTLPDLLKIDTPSGTCRVICFSPKHNITLAEMSIDEIKSVVDVWCRQISELGEKYRWVQIFENKGSIMGCSNPHPHGQIWATDTLPTEPTREDKEQLEYYQAKNSALLTDYLKLELKQKERIVLENEHWVVVVPFWAVWPYETLLMPRRQVLRMPELHKEERQSLANILKPLLVKYDNLFSSSFPYSMGWHGAPGGDSSDRHWQLHAHFYPPLLRSSTVKKFMVGYEMLAEAQRDLTAEQAAECLRNLSEIHYKSNQKKC